MPTCFTFPFFLGQGTRKRQGTRRFKGSKSDARFEGKEEPSVVEIGKDTGPSLLSASGLLPSPSPSPPTSPSSDGSRRFSNAGSSTSSSDTAPSSPLSNEEYPTLPLELWADVFGYVDDCALKALMLVNHTLSDEAERILYRRVFLKTSNSLACFSRSISTFPHRTALIKCIHIPYVEGHVNLAAIPTLLRKLDKLQRLTLNLFETRLPQDYLFVLDMILCIRFPSLRSLSLRVPLSLDNGFLQFLRAHPRLRHLDLGEIPPAGKTDYSSSQFPAISSLACTFRLLTSLHPLPSSLAHLHVLSCSSTQLVRVAELLGPQIVSLRLGSIYVPVQNMMHESVPMSLYDVAMRFPHLRFLQLDMGQEDKRYSRVQAVDYRIKRPESLRAPRPDATCITLVWAFSGPKHEGKEVWIEVGYQRFLNKAASEVLKEWGHYVAHIVTTHGTGAYERLALDEEGARLVRAVDRDMWEGYWRCV